MEALPLPGWQVGAYFNYNQSELAGDIPESKPRLGGGPDSLCTEDHIHIDQQLRMAAGRARNERHGGRRLFVHFSAKQRPADRSCKLREVFPAYETTSLRAGVKTDRWTALVNLANVFNNTATIADTTVQQGLYPQANIPNRPRTLSVTFHSKF